MAAYLPWMRIQVCQRLHWLSLQQLPGMTYAPVSVAVEGARSRLHMKAAASLHLAPWDGLDPGGALGNPVWKVSRKLWVRVGALLYLLVAL